MKKTYYYHDPVNDDFASTNIDTITLPDDYKYIDNSVLYRIGAVFIRAIFMSVLFIILKVGELIRVKNRKALKKVKGQGYFLYGNHTSYLLDAFMPTFISFPKRANIIVNPDAVSIKGLKTIVKMLGAVPIPTSLKGMRNYRKAIKELIEKKHAIAIYPEAHIWPYYTDIRPFGTQSFHYQVDLNAPCFVYTDIYTKRKFKLIKRPKVITYLDGPFYPDMNLSKPDRIQKLRDDVYNAMKKRVDENPKYYYYEYIYVDDESMTNKKQ